MKCSEDAIGFSCAGEALTGIVSRPDPNSNSTSTSTTGVVIVVGGPQYRAGSHRQFVMLARHLAASGHSTLRFDNRGMGDSSGAQRSFEALSDDIEAAIGALLTAAPQVQRVVLWGLCDAASAALLYLDERADPRVAGLALLNPWVRSEASLARTHVKHYYRQRLLQRDFWKKLLRGGVALGAVTGLAANLRSAAAGHVPGGGNESSSYQERMARGWQQFRHPVLLMLSGDDYTAREFHDHSGSDPRWKAALRQRPPTRLRVPGADHTCSDPAAQRAVEVATATWLRDLDVAAPAVATAPAAKAA